MIRVLVCGGREYSDLEKVYHVLSGIHKKHGIDLIIQGGADGADKLARIWANDLAVQCCTFHANWNGLGKAAGPIRNENMLELSKPDAVIAFKGGTGTAGMVKLAKEAGVTVWEPCK